MFQYALYGGWDNLTGEPVKQKQYHIIINMKNINIQF